MTDTCPDCGEEFERLATHLSQSDCEEATTEVTAEAEKQEARAVPEVQDDEHVAVGFEPADMDVDEIKRLIREINDARRSDEEHEREEHYDELHDELRRR